MQVTYEQLELVSYPEQTAGALAFHAKTSQSLVSKKDSLPESVVLCFLQLQGLLETSKKKIDPATYSLRTLKTYLVLTEGLTFSNFKLNWTKSGTMSNGQCLTQHRERIFIVGHLRGRSTRKVFPIIQSDRQTIIRSDTTNTLTARYGEAQGAGSYVGEGQSQKIKQVGNISDSDAFSGNPQVGRVYDIDGIAPTLSTMQGGGQEPKVVIPVSSPDVLNKNQNGRRFKNNGDPEFTLTARDKHGILTNNTKIRKLTPRECWRLQGFPDWAFNRARQAGLSDSQLYKQAGNSVTVPVIKAIAERIELEADK